MKKHYSDEVKAKVLQLLKDTGSRKETAKQAGLPLVAVNGIYNSHIAQQRKLSKTANLPTSIKIKTVETKNNGNGKTMIVITSDPEVIEAIKALL